jgi:hypothetical protein
MLVWEMMRAIANRGCEIDFTATTCCMPHRPCCAIRACRSSVPSKNSLDPSGSIILRNDACGTPDAQEAGGFDVDSTHGFNKRGISVGNIVSYWAWGAATQRSSTVLEIPVLVMDGALFS